MATKTNNVKNAAAPTKVEDNKPSRFNQIKDGAAKALTSDTAKNIGSVAAGCAVLGVAVFVGKLAWDTADRLVWAHRPYPHG